VRSYSLQNAEAVITIRATQAQIDAATVYEQLFVPAEFQEWAARLIDAAQIQMGQAVLDVACGTGVLARAVATRVGTSGRVVGIDPAPGMLAVAAKAAPGIELQQGTAELLPFEDATFDAVVSQFGLMYFTDRVKGLREMQRVLKPGGRMAVAAWGSLENTPAYATLVSLLDRFAGSAAADALRGPFVLGDVAQLADLFKQSGARDVKIQTHIGSAKFSDAREMVTAEIKGWLPVAGVVLSDEVAERILTQAENDLARFRIADGTVQFPAPAHIVALTKPR
jgi:SAM-dependent methyltransferase